MALFRYIPSEYVDSFLDGHIWFKPLSCHQQQENTDAVGYPHEAMRLFQPTSGLEINNLTTGERFTLLATLVSSVVANDIFVLCFSELRSGSQVLIFL